MKGGLRKELDRNLSIHLFTDVLHSVHPISVDVSNRCPLETMIFIACMVF